MTAGVRRHSMYLNDTLLALKRRGQSSGYKFADELARVSNRFERLLYLSLPVIPADELRELRRFMATLDELPPAFAMPKILAAAIEDSTDATMQDEAAVRASYALSRRVARMTAAQCLATVEATERWVRQRGSEQGDPLDSTLQ